MSTDHKNEKQTLDDAIERLEAEHRRRIDEKVERGEVVRVTLDPVVVGCPDSVEKAIEATKAEALARLRVAGEKREVIFDAALMDGDDEPITAIITGVPRARWGEDAPRIGDVKDVPGKGVQKWDGEAWQPMPYGTWTGEPPYFPPGSNLGNSSGTEQTREPAASEPAAIEWKPVRTQVSPPDERSPGVIIEARYHTANGELRLDLDGKLYAEALGPSDDPLVVARRLLRQKYGRHDEFYGLINYPPHSIH